MPFQTRPGLALREASEGPAFVRVLIAFGLLLYVATGAWAASSASVSLPQPGRVFTRTSGLRLDLTSHWVEANGYRPIEVEVISPFRPRRIVD